MRSNRLGLAGCLAVAAVSAGMVEAQETYVASTWNDQAVHVLDANMNDLRSFSAGSDLPNGIATDGDMVWTGHFTTEEVIAYNLNGVEQFRWSGPLSGLQGLEWVDGEILAATGDQIQFFDALTGAFQRSIPSPGFGVEGMTYDGQCLWLLDNDGIKCADINNGSISRQIPNAAGNCSFAGTGIAASGPGELTLACAEGEWYKVRSSDGGVISTGNNGLDMFGLKSLAGHGSNCVYTIKKSKAKGGCDACPDKGDEYASQASCEDVKDCDKKIKTTVSCPDGGNGTCKLSGKRSECD